MLQSVRVQEKKPRWMTLQLPTSTYYSSQVKRALSPMKQVMVANGGEVEDQEGHQPAQLVEAG